MFKLFLLNKSPVFADALIILTVVMRSPFLLIKRKSHRCWPCWSCHQHHDKKTKILLQANGANEDGTTFPGLGKIDYVLTEASVNINTIVISLLPRCHPFAPPLLNQAKHNIYLSRTNACKGEPMKEFHCSDFQQKKQSVVTSASIDRTNYGDASDHLPINAVLQMWFLKILKINSSEGT